MERVRKREIWVDNVKVIACIAVIHVTLGIAISFIGPMIAAVIMKKSKWLEFFLHPGKFIKMK